MQLPLFVLAHNIRSLYNVGSLFRLCDGVGVTKLYLSGFTGAPFNDIKHLRQRQQIAKTALAGLDSVNWEYQEDPFALIKELKSQHISIVALEQSTQSVPYTSISYQFPLCLILGHETEGVDERLLQEAEKIAEIPMLGKGKSLNVISAASVMLYHLSLSADSN